MAVFKKINFGDGLTVTDLGGGEITVAGVGVTGPTGPAGAPGATGPGVAAGGTAGQVLTKTSGTDYDTGWQTPSVATAPAMVKLTEIVQVTSTSDVFDFVSIPQTYTHLKVIVSARGIGAQVSNSVVLRCNGDVSAVYDFQRLQAWAANLAASESLGVDRLRICPIPAAAAPADTFGQIEILFASYRDTHHKTVDSQGLFKQGTGSGSLFVIRDVGQWRSNSPINRIQVLNETDKFVVGSRATLYGLT